MVILATTIFCGGCLQLFCAGGKEAVGFRALPCPMRKRTAAVWRGPGQQGLLFQVGDLLRNCLLTSKIGGISCLLPTSSAFVHQSFKPRLAIPKEIIIRGPHCGNVIKNVSSRTLLTSMEEAEQYLPARGSPSCVVSGRPPFQK